MRQKIVIEVGARRINCGSRRGIYLSKSSVITKCNHVGENRPYSEASKANGLNKANNTPNIGAESINELIAIEGENSLVERAVCHSITKRKKLLRLMFMVFSSRLVTKPNTDVLQAKPPWTQNGHYHHRGENPSKTNLQAFSQQEMYKTISQTSRLRASRFCCGSHRC